VFTVPAILKTPPAWKLVGLWVTIGLIQLLISPWVMRLVFTIFPTSRPNAWFILSGMATALIIYSLQWLVLRRYFLGMRWWAPAHVTATFIVVLVSDVLERLSSGLMAILGFVSHSITIMEHYLFLASTIVSVVWAMIFGLVGWRIFRAAVPGAGRWIWAKVGGQIISSLVIFWLVLPFWKANPGQPFPLTVRLIVHAAVLAPFSIEAFVLVQFLDKRYSEASDEGLGTRG
jgi:hypothetical protein